MPEFLPRPFKGGFSGPTSLAGRFDFARNQGAGVPGGAAAPPAIVARPQAPAAMPVPYPSSTPLPSSAGAGDYSERSNEYFGLLDTLKNRGYLGDGTASTSSSSDGSGGAGGGVWTPEMPTGGGAPGVAPVDTTAKNAAIFARAKDQVGETSTGALAGLRSALAGRGMLGSGSELRGTAATVNTGQRELGDTTRENAIQDAAIREREALANQQAQVATRGQDIEALNARNAARLTARGQDLSAKESAASRASSSRDAILALWKQFSGGRY